MINLHESMGPGRDRTRDPWICSQTRICCQTRYRLRYAARLKACYVKSLLKYQAFPYLIYHLFAYWVMCLSKLTYLKKFCHNAIKVSNSLDPDQVSLFVRPDLGPNCLQRFSAADKNKRVKEATKIQKSKCGASVVTDDNLYK